MTPPERDELHDLEVRYEAAVSAYDEVLVEGSSVPAFDDTIVPPELLPRFREIQSCLELLAEGRRTGELALALGLANASPTESRESNKDLPICKQIGRFEIQRELGRGGYGVVFLANDPRLQRLVALKVPRPEALMMPDLRRRFLREAQAAGGLEHPNLVAVYEVGEDGPLCYIASSYCEGPTLAQWLKARALAVSIREAAMLVFALAGGVEHAHQRGVLHRDIKPSNVLLEAVPDQGNRSDLSSFTPRLTDFGLAKLLEIPTDETRTGALLGTPAYMAPEQAEGRLKDIGPTTDVYALGVLLYELVAGRPPFQGDSDVQLLQQVAQNDVPRPSTFRDHLPRDVQAIILKCLQRQPARRYTSAGELARDLDRFLTGSPTLARPASSAERLIKWARRRPVIASLSGAICLATLALAGGGWWYSGQLRLALGEARMRWLENQRFLYVASVNLAERALSSGNIQQAEDQLTRAVPQAGEPDLRDFAWHYLWRQLHEEELTLRSHEADVFCVRYATKQPWLATASKDRTARVWDVTSGKCLHVLQASGGEVNCLAFSNEDNQIASAHDDGKVRIWDLATAQLRFTLACHPGGVTGVAYSPDGRRLATCGRDKKALLWDTSRLEKLAVLTGHDDEVNALAFSPSGELLATASDDQTVLLWKVETAEAIATLKGHSSAVNAVAFSTDGRQLATAGQADRMVLIWDAATGNKIKELGPQYDWIHAVQFCNHDSQLAVATKGGELTLVDVGTTEVVRQLRGHKERIWSLSVSPDGAHLADASADRTVKIWNLVEANHAVVQDEVDASHNLLLTPNGNACVTSVGNSPMTIWDIATRKVSRRAGRDFEIAGDFSGDGVQETGYFQDGIWHLCILPDRHDVNRFTERTVRFGAIDDIPVVGDWDGDGKDDLGVFRPSNATWYFDLDGIGGASENEREFELVEHTSNPLFPRNVPVVGRWDNQSQDLIGLASFRDAQWNFRLATSEDNVDIGIRHGDHRSVPMAWNTGAEDVLALIDPNGVWIRELPTELDPGSKTVAEVLSQSAHPGVNTRPAAERFIARDKWPGSQGSLDAARDRAVATHVWSPRPLAISPLGDVLADSEFNDSRVKVWDVRSGHRLAVLRCPSGDILDLAFAPDGRTLAAGTDSGSVTLWDTSRFQERGTIRAHKPGGLRVVYAPDGSCLATCGNEGEIKLWDPSGKSQIRAFREDDRYEIQTITFSPDSKIVSVAGSNRVITLWDPSTGQVIARLVGHADVVNAVAFSPDGRTLASGSSDRTVRLWDLFTKQELYALRDPSARVMAVTFDSTGRELIAAAYTAQGGGALHFWSTKSPPSTIQVGAE